MTQEEKTQIEERIVDMAPEIVEKVEKIIDKKKEKETL